MQTGSRIFLRVFAVIHLWLAGTDMLFAQADENFYKSRHTTKEYLDYGTDSLNLEDTSMNDFHLFQPIFRSNFGLMDLGNIVTPSSPVVFPGNTNTGFQLGWNYLDPYLFSARKDNRYYSSQKPLTSLTYSQGARELIRLEAVHAQNIKPNWNMGVEYRRIKEDGFYLKQKTSLYNIRLFNWYHTRDYRYHLLASATFDRILNEESGGLFSRESFDTLDGPTRVAAVRFYGSGTVRAQNRVRVNTFSATQYFRLGKNVYFPTEARDTANRPIADTIPTLVPVSQLFLHTEYSVYQNIFSINELTGLGFDTFHRAIMSTYDSLSYRTANVSVGFQNGQYKVIEGDSLEIRRKRWHYSASLNYRFVLVKWEEDYARYHNLSAEGKWGTNPFNPALKFHFSADHYQGLTGYNAGDYQTRLFATLKTGKWKPGVSAMSKLYAPDFNQYYYLGNHHFWFNKDFKKQLRNEIKAFVSTTGNKGQKMGFEVTALTLGNYIYYDTSARPVQSTNSLNLVQFSLNSHLKKGVFNLRSKVVFQQGDIRNEIRVPQWLMHHTVYAEGHLFKGALWASAGIDFFYSSSFQALVYEAPVRSFRLQDGFSMGNYPYFNVYITGQIKTVTFFFCFQHVNMGLTSTNWYSSPNYPMEPRALRLGLRWKLYD